MPPTSTNHALQPKGTMNGVLPIPVSVTQKANTPVTQRNMPAKAAAPKLKMVLRRLPPGLTQAELETALGEEWKVGVGKVDYFLYKEGKISKDPSKPSRPSRAYFRVTSQTHISSLSDAVRQITFQDARNTSKDPVLLGPPSLEFSTYTRVPGNRLRKDARQGTIDQDPEFIDFLESLTNPIVKSSTGEENDGAEKKDDKAKVTPLIQFLRDKKANKGKDVASTAKASKHARQESKDTKAEKPAAQSKKLLNRPEKDSPSDKKGRRDSKVDKAAKEAVKVLNKQATTSNAKLSEKPQVQAPAKESTPPPVERKRERGSARGAAAILQRDLGIIPPGGGRRRQKLPSPEMGKASPAIVTPPQPSIPASDKAPNTQPSTQVPTSPKPTSAKPSNTAPPTGPAASRHAAKQNSPAQATPSPKASKAIPPPSPVPLPTGTQAFLKHANPSQGITEPLLEEAFSVYGKLTKVEIDKRKGFGYLDFETPEGLHKAIQASPVKIAQGQVMVLELKPKPTLAVRNVRGGGNNLPMRGGHAASAPPPPSAPASGRGAPQGPAMRPPQGPRGGRGRGGHRGGMGRGGNGGSNAPPTVNPSSSSPVSITAPAPSTPTSVPVAEP